MASIEWAHHMHRARLLRTGEGGECAFYLLVCFLLSEYGAWLLVEIKRRQEKGKLTISCDFFIFSAETMQVQNSSVKQNQAVGPRRHKGN